MKNDIELWSPKVKSGGVIIGHDYYHKDVNKVVNEIYPSANRRYIIRNNISAVWWIKKELE